jgi:hypothetical protein
MPSIKPAPVYQQNPDTRYVKPDPKVEAEQLAKEKAAQEAYLSKSLGNPTTNANSTIPRPTAGTIPPQARAQFDMLSKPTSPRYVGTGNGVPETYEGRGTGNGPSPGYNVPPPAPGMKPGMGTSAPVAPKPTPMPIDQGPAQIAKAKGFDMSALGPGFSNPMNPPVGRPTPLPMRPTSPSMTMPKAPMRGTAMKSGGSVKKMASGGSVSSASKRGDGIAQRGKTKGRMC